MVVMLLCNVPVCKYLLYLQTCLLLGAGVSTILFLWGFFFFTKLAVIETKRPATSVGTLVFMGRKAWTAQEVT